MGQQCPYSPRWEGLILLILDVLGYRSTLLLFCVHQETESDKWEMQISVPHTISTQKITGSMGQLCPSSTIW